jgi:murein DD-endopeptidase MepM/ murein hydrolase activator NlpD
MVQGALLVGETLPGARVTLDGSPLMVSSSGVFAFGFDRDQGPSARLEVTFPDGRIETRSLTIAPRSYAIQRIEGIAPKFVNPPAEVLSRIARESKQKKEARSHWRDATWFQSPFLWPTKGPISGVFGSHRFYNGEAKRPHFGVDIAAGMGAPIIAPADGIVTLAESDMYFEGGLIFLDHGQGVTSYYMHLSRIDVKAGQMVRQGEMLGAVGASGRSTGPHLHWAMFWRSAHLDPSVLIPGVGAEGPKPGMLVGE